MGRERRDMVTRALVGFPRSEIMPPSKVYIPRACKQFLSAAPQEHNLGLFSGVVERILFQLL